MSRLLHLGTKKGCPLCQDVQKRSLSQIREYRFSIERGELFRVVAACFAYNDNRVPLWDVLGYQTMLFGKVYPPNYQGQAANEFMEMAGSEFGSDPASIRRGSEAELEQYENDYLRKLNGETMDCSRMSNAVFKLSIEIYKFSRSIRSS